MHRNKGVAMKVLEAVRNSDKSEDVSSIYVIRRCEKACYVEEEVNLMIDLLKSGGYLTETTHILKVTPSGDDLLETLKAEFFEEMRALINRL